MPKLLRVDQADCYPYICWVPENVLKYRSDLFKCTWHLQKLSYNYILHKYIYIYSFFPMWQVKCIRCCAATQVLHIGIDINISKYWCNVSWEFCFATLVTLDWCYPQNVDKTIKEDGHEYLNNFLKKCTLTRNCLLLVLHLIVISNWGNKLY